MSEAGALAVRLAQQAPIPLDATFECAAGEMLALVGPSGSGKSTILRCIAGLHAALSGRIACGSDVWFDAKPKAQRLQNEIDGLKLRMAVAAERLVQTLPR